MEIMLKEKCRACPLLGIEFNSSLNAWPTRGVRNDQFIRGPDAIDRSEGGGKLQMIFPTMIPID